MKIYKVDAESYYKKFRGDKRIEELGYSFECYIDTMTQLIERFNLKNKRVLSIGALFGLEEYYFYVNGCNLTFIDKNIYSERYLTILPHSDNPTLTYIIEEIQNIDLNEEWDILYIGSLPPELLFENDLIFSEVMMKFVNNIKEGGLFISQSYSKGPLMADPVNIKAIREQFKLYDLQLLDVYHFNVYTNVHLIIGFKGSMEKALEFIEIVNKNPDITNFSGRSRNKRGITKSYQLINVKKYEVDALSYFEKLREDKIPKELGYSLEIFTEPMTQLINRFNLRDKKVLSIGALFGFEEYYFSTNGCNLTLIDNNPYSIRHLETLESSDNQTLTYIIGDIRDIVKNPFEKYDVIFTSGLPQDLLWSEHGFSDIILECIRKFLDKGLFICQSYQGGLEMNDPISIELIKEQCKRENLHLVSIYYFTPQYVHVSLTTIFKGSKEEFEQYIESIKGNPEITLFHGRSKVIDVPKIAYQFGGKKRMKINKLDKDDYFQKVHSKWGKELLAKKAMNQLITRFGLQEKRVLAIGSYIGFEEYWFYNANCKLTMMDFSVFMEEEYIPTIKKGDNLTYIIEDMKDLCFDSEWEVLYLAALPAVLLFEDDRIFSELIMRYASYIKRKGIFISQSYSLGPLMDDPTNINAIKEQFELNGLQLLSVYHFNPYPNISLIIGFKGTLEEAQEFIEIVEGRPEITNFHGGSQMKREVIKSYQLEVINE